MRKRNKIIMAVVTLLAISTVYAAQAGAGTTEDPIVTKSYVDQKIAELAKGQGGSTSGTTPSTGIGTYEVVSLEPGQMLVGKQGTEIIMRSGEGVIVASEAGGVQDITGGSDLAGGKSVPKYHLLLIPRDDGRGIVVTKSMYVMVRGGYTIQ